MSARDVTDAGKLVPLRKTVAEKEEPAGEDDLVSLIKETFDAREVEE